MDTESLKETKKTVKNSFLAIMASESPSESLGPWFTNIVGLTPGSLDFFNALLLMEEAFETLDIGTCKATFGHLVTLVEENTVPHI